MLSVSDAVTLDGKVFQACCPATNNAWSPIVVRHEDGVPSRHSLFLESMSATRRSSLARYGRAVPCRHQKTSTDSLNSIIIILGHRLYIHVLFGTQHLILNCCTWTISWYQSVVLVTTFLSCVSADYIWGVFSNSPVKQAGPLGRPMLDRSAVGQLSSLSSRTKRQSLPFCSTG